MDVKYGMAVIQIRISGSGVKPVECKGFKNTYVETFPKIFKTFPVGVHAWPPSGPSMDDIHQGWIQGGLGAEVPPSPLTVGVYLAIC